MTATSNAQASKGGNTCDNSYYSLSVEERILKAIDESEIEMKPYEIAHKVHAKRSTVRVKIRTLLDRGLIIQPYPGAYCNKITYGMRFVPRLVHNVRLRSFVCQDVRHDVVKEAVGGVVLEVVFGSERRKISGGVYCDAGMSRDTCFFAINRWFDLAEAKLGFGLNDLELTTFEVNKDYHGVRVEGVQCLTRSDLFGMIERFYQKEDNVLRHEWKVTKPTSINEFEATLKNGCENAEKAQASFETKEELTRLREAVKFNNSRMLAFEKMLEGMSKAIIRMADGDAAPGDVKPLNHSGDYSR